MNEGKISKRYAKALLLYAKEQNADELVYNDMKKLVRTFKAAPKLEFSLKNPMLPSSKKLKLLNAAFDDKPLPVVLKFFNLVLANKRITFIKLMALWYIDFYQQSQNLISARLVTALPPSDGMIAKIKALSVNIVPGELMFESTVDATIKGGFVLYIDTYRLDASIASQLKQIRQHFVEENRKIATI